MAKDISEMGMIILNKLDNMKIIQDKCNQEGSVVLTDEFRKDIIIIQDYIRMMNYDLKINEETIYALKNEIEELKNKEKNNAPIKCKCDIGDYVRDKYGNIIKIKKMEYDEEAQDYYLYGEKMLENCWNKDVVKSDYELIKIIEVGDYVNDSIVTDINCNFEYIDDDSDGGVSETNDGIRTKDEDIISDEFILNVMTKELFEKFRFNKC